MARIDALPSIEIIRGFKGILDFYLWRGLPCVRAWPKYRPAKQTEASLAAALTFGAIVKAYALLANQVLTTYRQDALDQPRTARDIMLTGVYGNLHEASMSDFLDALIIIRDAVVALTDLLHALDSIDTDEIVVNVDQSVLPPDAATHTRQLSMLAALTKIDDLQDALESKALDRLLVRGMDQLHSYNAPLAKRTEDTISGADGWIQSATPAAGLIWHVTHINTRDQTSATTSSRLDAFLTATWAALANDVRAIPALEYVAFPVDIWLENSDRIYAYFAGGQAGDTCDINFVGHIFTKET